MKFLEGDIVETKVEKEGYKAGTKGVVVHIFEGHEACVVEIWDATNYPIDTINYYFNELELVLREND